jgi:hypothetical protein
MMPPIVIPINIYYANKLAKVAPPIYQPGPQKIANPYE